METIILILKNHIIKNFNTSLNSFNKMKIVIDKRDESLEASLNSLNLYLIQLHGSYEYS